MQSTEEQPVKLADTEYPIHELLQKRWSPRAFSEKLIDTELLNQLFEAARWAPSSYNEQPWRFIVARKDDKEAYKQLASVMNEFNQSWATDAPVLVLALTKTTFDLDGRENPHAGHDLGQAIAHLTFEATKNNLYVHQMAGILPEKARELYDISGDYKPMTMFAIGYRGQPESLNDKMRKQETSPRIRKDLDEIVFDGEWKNN
ncbi:nitroreductase family protein [Fodinibius sp.]|uniref:nitroreductase family protein n=1 Tax=Fodinibius sp. TaxID=1872440 RepID=UPI002ACEF2FF|nr:nitroreductase family protein [Fodinibius sp.]MDZ7658993.1 nitroreductase family protein [Fodinibius sp.]